MTDEWRSVIAVLANDEGRRMLARLILGESLDSATAELSVGRREKVVRSLERSGLLDDHSGALREQRFRELLEAAPAPRATGVERYLDGERIRQWPARPADRLALLRWVATRALAAGEVVDERTMNERLARVSDDTALLRRYLVDHGLVERRADGSQYALVADRGALENLVRERLAGYDPLGELVADRRRDDARDDGLPDARP
ncbi:DUF2087 domain-containing protein [Microcella daejeonensis]|uniref:DUF2087 domain-containing protein n=1 Tax=Microcella daejeonensis TaxID=2994971 RepID=A0A9E8MKT2_9MICO|nr:DUF2087 domain-containing protein [Microcella daejeonensis]WAB81429.1 DUF2087 domain-containing protein [Microcella daejeonensis]